MKALPQRSVPTLGLILLAAAFAAFAALAAPPAASAQSASAASGLRALDHDDYDRWNRIAGERLSPDGRWLAYALVPGDGDGAVLVRNLESGRELRLERGTSPTFTDDSRFVAVTVRPPKEVLEKAEKAKKKDDDVSLPKDSLVVVELARAFRGNEPDADAVLRVAEVKSFLVPEEERALVAYLLEPEEDDEEEGDAGAAAEEGAEEEEGEEPGKGDREKAEGSTLVLLDPATGAEHRFADATEYGFDETGRVLYYAASSEDGTADGVYRVDTANGAVSTVLSGEGAYVKLAVDDDGDVAFLTDRDDREADQPALALYTAGPAGGAGVLVAADAPGIPEGWWISDKGDVRFSEEGSRILFGTRERPEPDEDAAGDEGDQGPGDAGEDDGADDDEEQVEVDVWNWKDDYLQPMQLVRARESGDRAYDAIVPASGGSVVQLETTDVPDVTVAGEGDGPVALAASDIPYRKLLSWDGRYNDLWIIDVETGERQKVAEAVKGFSGGALSPEGRFVYWWDGGERHWFAHDLDRGTTQNLTADIDAVFWDELDDHPDEPPAYGVAGWTADGSALLYDAHDIWLVDPAGRAAARNVTEGVGRREGIRFRYVPVDDEGAPFAFFSAPQREFVPIGESVYLSAFDLDTKESGFYRDRFAGSGAPERLAWGPYEYGRPTKAEDAERLLLTRETFREFPDLWVADADLEGMEKASEANPFQDEYRWGTAELVEWISVDGIPLKGILYKPDGFDPSETYPLMVYFYERSADGLHGYHVPAAGSSSINRSFYVSRGYLLFVPDIPYEIGFPGESAMDAVVPGVLSLIGEGFVDAERIGVQGHSWGGYQISHMITRTDIFAAAEAGAPVSNMTSAYGGIRWGTGMSRMFQYERTQSRIGGTLWDAQHRFIENSPLFFADKIRTPLLMMHNDEDGAVPWYQGIEFFVALRRLDKPVWMLNYNGEDHGLRQEHNRKDWAIRMQQFFDHFLLDAPAPVWLAEGVPAAEKGETLGLDLITEEGAVSPVTEAGTEGGGGG